MLLTQKSIPVLVHDVTGKMLPFVEIWKLMYFREHYAPRGHWVSPPSGDILPEWFYRQFNAYIEEEEIKRHGKPEPIIDLTEVDEDSVAVTSLRMEHGDEKWVRGNNSHEFA
jgi:hypothetical protein